MEILVVLVIFYVVGFFLVPVAIWVHWAEDYLSANQIPHERRIFVKLFISFLWPFALVYLFIRWIFK
jgi:hypothetical protein